MQKLLNGYHMKKNLWQYSSPINWIGSVQIDSMSSQECDFEALIIEKSFEHFLAVIKVAIDTDDFKASQF